MSATPPDRTRRRAGWAVLGLVLVVGLVAVLVSRLSPSPASSPASSPAASTGPSSKLDPESGLPWVALAELPREAVQTVALIDRGGPFPYPKDGATFANREQLLPPRPRGYYREYTVRTPGSADRGARRVVTGDADRQLFYTGDHYASFARIRR